MILKEGGRINSQPSTFEQGICDMLNLSSSGGGGVDCLRSRITDRVMSIPV